MSERQPNNSDQADAEQADVYNGINKDMLNGLTELASTIDDRYQSGENTTPASEYRSQAKQLLYDAGYEQNAFKLMHNMNNNEIRDFIQGSLEESERRKANELESIVAAFDSNDTYGDRRTALSNILTVSGDKAGWRKIYDMNNIELKAFVKDARDELKALSPPVENEVQPEVEANAPEQVSVVSTAAEQQIVSEKIGESAEKPDMSDYHANMKRPLKTNTMTAAQKRRQRRKTADALNALSVEDKVEPAAIEATIGAEPVAAAELNTVVESSDIVEEPTEIKKPVSRIPNPGDYSERPDFSRGADSTDGMNQDWMKTINLEEQVITPVSDEEKAVDNKVSQGPNQDWMRTINVQEQQLSFVPDNRLEDSIDETPIDFEATPEARGGRIRSAISNMRNRFSAFRNRLASRNTYADVDEYEKVEEKNHKVRNIALGAAAIAAVAIAAKYGYDHDAFSGLFGGGGSGGGGVLTPEQIPSSEAPIMQPGDVGITPDAIPPAEIPAPNGNFLTDFNVADGQGGTEFLSDNNIDPSKWYGFENDALSRFPNELYRMNDGHVGIANAGDMSSSLQQYIFARK